MSAKRAHDKPPIILGWREWVALPDLGIDALKAKLDTGARSSALHVIDIEPFRRKGKAWVRFRIVTDAGLSRAEAAEAPVADQRMVRDSGGREHHRIAIITNVEVAGWSWPIEVTLATRSEMSFRMLLGRQGLSGRVVVDPSHSYLAGRSTVSAKHAR